jgi:hypothetical protein
MMNPENRNNYPALLHQARQTDIVEWLRQNDPALYGKLRRVGSEYTLEDMDSIRIDGHKWYRFSQDTGGNAIDFLTHIYNISDKEAIIRLTGVDLTGKEKSAPKPKEDGAKEKKEEPPRAGNVREFDFNAIELNADQRRVIAYLTKNRGISAAVVLDEIKQKRLFQEAGTGNAIFAMLDETGAIVGADCVGTLSFTRFKGIKTGSKYGYGYNTGERQEPRYILYFESAIDLLSFITIERERGKPLTGCLLVSMAGLKAAIVGQTLKVFGESAARPVFCVDNDNAGNRFIAEILLAYPNAIVRQPDKDYKDWNDQLLEKKIDK